jgi:hypothetical protein
MGTFLFCGVLRERMIKGLFKKLDLKRNTGEWTENKKTKRASNHFKRHGTVDILS